MANNTRQETAAEFASRRLDELANEIAQQYEQRGQESHFGFDTGIAVQHILQAYAEILSVGAKLGDRRHIAFELPGQDAALLDKALGLPFKFIAGLRICAIVRKLVIREGGDLAAEIECYWDLVLHGSTLRIREEAIIDLLSAAGPFYKWAQEILQGEIETYNPVAITGPVDYRFKEG